MAARLGNAVLVLAVVLAAGWIWLNAAMDQSQMGVVVAMSAAVVGLGALVRYVLAGGRKRA